MRPLERTPTLVLLAGLLSAAACGGDEEAGPESTGEIPDEAPAPAVEVEERDGRRPFLKAARHPRYGAYVQNRREQTLYVFTADSAGEPTCYDRCAEVWPPWVVAEGDPIGEEPVEDELLGTVTRRNGELQVTYDGWPLYYYAEDGSGGVDGQDVSGFGGEWYLIGPDGRIIRTEPAGGGEDSAGSARAPGSSGS